MRKKEYERELTGKESAICMIIGLIAIILIGNNDVMVPWGLVDWIRMMLGVTIALGVCIWQNKLMQNPIDKEDVNGK